MEKLLLIDGTGLVYRGFYSIPPFFRSPTGVQTNAVFGFSSIVLSLLADYKPTYCAVTFDKKGPTFRHVEFTEYKATRTKAPDELYAQFPLVKDVVRAFGLPLIEIDGFEADDSIATIARRLADKSDLQILIASGDFDVFQVVTPNTSILYPTKGFKGADIFDREKIKEKYGIFPEQIPDYKGLAGDSSDNIPGVHGIGDKGACKLLDEYKTMENIYEHIDEIKGAVGDKLRAGKESAFKSKYLATLRYDTPIDFNLEECTVHKFNSTSIKAEFKKLGCSSLAKRIDEMYPHQDPQASLF